MGARIRDTAIAVLAIASIGLVWFLFQASTNDAGVASLQDSAFDGGINWGNSDPQAYKLAMDSSMQMSTTANAPSQDIEVTMRASLIVTPLSLAPAQVTVGIAARRPEAEGFRTI